MIIQNLIDWIKSFFFESKHNDYVSPTKPSNPWPYPMVMGDHCPKLAKKKPAVKKAVKKKPVAKKVAVKKVVKKKPVTKKVK